MQLRITRKYVRFGWRHFTIRGRDLLLYGEKIQQFRDLVHPFGPYMYSQRYVRALVLDSAGSRSEQLPSA
jgi:hypothetical protein